MNSLILYTVLQTTILLPLGLYRAPGAFGSLWQTELAMKNTSRQAIQIIEAGQQCSITCPYEPMMLAPGHSLLIAPESSSLLLASRSGLVVNVAGTASVAPGDLQFNLRIHDVSRSVATWGTELPVVTASDFRTSAIELLNVPVTPGFRSTVRVYALEGSTPIAAIARVYDFATGQLLATREFSLDRDPQRPAAFYPAYAQLDALVDGLPSDRVIIEVAAANSGQPLWAFASITNNETQEITLVTPH